MTETLKYDLDRMNSIADLLHDRWNIHSLSHTDTNTYVLRYYPLDVNLSQFQLLVELEQWYNIDVLEHWYHERSLKVRLELKKEYRKDNLKGRNDGK